MAAHARLKNDLTEGEKCAIISWAGSIVFKDQKPLFCLKILQVRDPFPFRFAFYVKTL